MATNDADFFMLTDDDVYINAPRLLRDLYHLLDQPHHVIYGPLAFAGGWDAQKPAVHVGHYGWSPYSSIEARLPRLLRDHRKVTYRSQRRRAKSSSSNEKKHCHEVDPFEVGTGIPRPNLSTLTTGL